MKNVDCFKEEQYCIIDLIIRIVVNVNVLKHQVNVVISINGFISTTFSKIWWLHCPIVKFSAKYHKRLEVKKLDYNEEKLWSQICHWVKGN